MPQDANDPQPPQPQPSLHAWDPTRQPNRFRHQLDGVGALDAHDPRAPLPLPPPVSTRWSPTTTTTTTLASEQREEEALLGTQTSPPQLRHPLVRNALPLPHANSDHSTRPSQLFLQQHQRAAADDDDSTTTPVFAVPADGGFSPASSSESGTAAATPSSASSSPPSSSPTFSLRVAIPPASFAPSSLSPSSSSSPGASPTSSRRSASPTCSVASSAFSLSSSTSRRSSSLDRKAATSTSSPVTAALNTSPHLGSKKDAGLQSVLPLFSLSSGDHHYSHHHNRHHRILPARLFSKRVWRRVLFGAVAAVLLLLGASVHIVLSRDRDFKVAVASDGAESQLIRPVTDSLVCFADQWRHLITDMLRLPGASTVDSAPCSDVVLNATALSETQSRHGQRPDVEWVTFITSCSSGINRFAEGVHGTGIPLTVLGLHEPWRGWGRRVRAYADYAAAVARADPARLLILTDASDVLILPNTTADDIWSAWAVAAARGGSLDAVLMGTETALWPDEQLAPAYLDRDNVWRPAGVRHPLDAMALHRRPAPQTWALQHPGRNRIWNGQGSPLAFLNAGLVVGRASSVAALFSRVYTSECADDQLALHLAYLRRDAVWTRDPALALDGGDDNNGPVAAAVARLDAAETEDRDNDPVAAARFDEARAAVVDVVRAEAERRRYLVAHGADPSVVVAASRPAIGVPKYDAAFPAPPPSAFPPLGPAFDDAGQVTDDNGSSPAVPPPAFVPPPARARPLLVLDTETELFAGLYMKFAADFVFDHHYPSSPSPSSSSSSSSPSSPSTRPRHPLFRPTGNRPFVLHQSGRKIENRVLEVVAREVGLRHSGKAVEVAGRFVSGRVKAVKTGP